MKNPQITTKLNRMMADEKQERINVIGCILDYYKISNPQMVNSDTFDALYELDLAQLNDELSDILSHYFHLINEKLIA